MATPIDPDLLDLLVCPLTRSPLKQEGDELVATVGGLRYPIREGIPVMLVEEAKMPPGIANLDEFKQKFADMIAT
ncbi:MAG: Trm112 family protein [Phycisphaeraceae bacterium]